MIRLRFAPSPTGLLHVGNARVALANWLFARARGGSFLLRLDDTDSERSTKDYAAAIEEDLSWLELHWDEFARQSDRMDRYESAAERLKASGRLYPCYETPEELALKRKSALAAGRPPIYDRAALKLDSTARAAAEASGRRPHWRFKLEAGEIAWEDLVRGPCRFEGENLSDPVLLREDGRPLYTLSSVVDDLELDVSHVFRGEDHVANTAVQVQIFEALGGRTPVFAHLPLMVDASGQGLSKRLGSLSLRALREESIEPMALTSYLAKVGTSDAIEPRQNLQTLIEEFDISHVSRAAPRFDMAELRNLNAKLLHAMPYGDVEPWLRQRGLEAVTEDFWNAVRANLTRRGEIGEWIAVCTRPIEPKIEDPQFLEAAASHLPPEPWGQDTWQQWTDSLAAATGRKGRKLYHPLRVALTARERGPEMWALLPVMGRARVLKRLAGETA